MSQLKDYFDAERKRVFEPDPLFAKRVMARLNQTTPQDHGIWDFGSSFRPALAVALVLFLCLVVIHVFVPQTPQRGMVESFLEPEQSPADSFLYNDNGVPSRPDVMAQLISLPERDD